MSNQHKVIDIETDTVSDFSIMVTYLPKTAREPEIKEFFETQFPGVQVAQISLAYDIEKLSKLNTLYDLEETTYLEAVGFWLTKINSGIESQEWLNKLSERVDRIKKDANAHKKYMLDHHETFFTGIAFVTFEKMDHADKITSEWEMTTLNWILHGFKYKLKWSDQKTLLRIDKGPEAEEVVWENLKFPFREQVKKKLVTLLVTLGILGVAFSIIFGLKYLNYEAKKKFKGSPIPYAKADGTTSFKLRELSSSEEGLLQFISIGIYVVSKIINKIFDKVMGALTKLEKHYTVGDYNVSAVIKTVIAQFLNTSCLIVIVHAILNSTERYFIWGSGGLMTDIQMVLIFNSIVLPLLNLVNFGLIGKLFKRCKLKKHADSKMYTQKQAHEIMEGVPMDPIRSYTDIYQILLTCCFFLPALPANALIHCLSLAAIYWIQKVYLLRFYTRPRLLQASIAFNTLIFVKIAGFVVSISELYFDWILRDEYHTTLVIQSVFTFLMIWIPVEDKIKPNCANETRICYLRFTNTQEMKRPSNKT